MSWAVRGAAASAVGQLVDQVSQAVRVDVEVNHDGAQLAQNLTRVLVHGTVAVETFEELDHSGALASQIA